MHYYHDDVGRKLIKFSESGNQTQVPHATWPLRIVMLLTYYVLENILYAVYYPLLLIIVQL